MFNKYKKRYIIYAPKLSRSMGIRALYELYNFLKAQGCEVRMFCPDQHLPNYLYLDHLNSETRRQDIVVYPEIVKGNPLGFNNVVRYVLFFPSKLGGDLEYSSNEFIITWDSLYYPDVPVLKFDLIDRDIFYNSFAEKTQDCVLIYKGGKWKRIKELEGLTEITMDYPKSQKLLADLLRTTRILYSFDHYSSTLDEALLCGATVKLIFEDGFRDYIGSRLPAVEETTQQLIGIIKATQQLSGKAGIQNQLKRKKAILTLRAKYFILRMIQPLTPTDWYEKKINRYKKKLAWFGVSL